MIMLLSIIIIIVSYFIGAIPTSYILCKVKTNTDIRTVGSKNVGATNASRILGKKWFIIITLLDAAKGFIPVYVSKMLISHTMFTALPIAAGLAAILGHMYPIYLKFKGGKGVAVSSGVFLAFDYRIVIVGLLIFILVLLITRYISAGSILGSLSLPISYYYFNRNNISIIFLIFTLFVMIYVIFKHRKNISRIIKREENKWGEKI